MKNILILYILIIFYSCSDLNIKKMFYDTGELKEIQYLDNEGLRQEEYTVYYKKGNKKIFARYKNGKYIDTMYFFYNDNQIKFKKFHSELTPEKDSVYVYDEFNENITKGLLSENGDLIGITEKYSLKTGRKISKIEIIKKDGELIENQIIDYINKEKSHFYKLSCIDTVYKNKFYPLSIELNAPKDFHAIYLCVNKHINEDFSNLNELKLDTILGDLSNNKVQTNIRFTNEGNITLRGFIEGKYFKLNHLKSDSTKVEVVRMKTTIFINKKIYVLPDSAPLSLE